MALTPLRGLQAEGCHVVDLTQFLAKPDSSFFTLHSSLNNSRPTTVNIIKGLGYDGHVLQFGDPTKDPEGGKSESIEYKFHAPSDSVDIIIYAVPFWPLYKGKPNRISVSIDNQPEQVFENKFKEYDRTWKDQVMRNGIMCRLRFAVDQQREANCLRIQADPGQMIQRIIIDWGGLQPSYIGPGI